MRNDIVIVKADGVPTKKDYIVAFNPHIGAPSREELKAFLDVTFPEETEVEMEGVRFGASSMSFSVYNERGGLPEPQPIRNNLNINRNKAIHDTRNEKLVAIGDVVSFNEGITKVRGQIVRLNPITVRSEGNRLYEMKSEDIVRFEELEASLAKNVRIGDKVQFVHQGQECVGTVIDLKPVRISRPGETNVKLEKSEDITAILGVDNNPEMSAIRSRLNIGEDIIKKQLGI